MFRYYVYRFIQAWACDPLQVDDGVIAVISVISHMIPGVF